MKIDYFALRQARKRAHMTLEDAGKQLGLNKSTIQNYEDKRTKIPAEVLFMMVDLYGVDLADLIDCPV